jgi:hypothetical protein
MRVMISEPSLSSAWNSTLSPAKEPAAELRRKHHGHGRHVQVLDFFMADRQLAVRVSTRVISPAVSTSAWPVDAVAEASARHDRVPSDPVRKRELSVQCQAQGRQSGVKEVFHHVFLNGVSRDSW